MTRQESHAAYLRKTKVWSKDQVFTVMPIQALPHLGDIQQTSVTDKNLSNLCFGTSLAQFLEVELRDFPGRRVAALRLFIVALIIALVNETLLLPPLGAIALLICLSYDAYANSGQALAFGLPMVVTDVGEVGEMVVEGVTGFAVKDREPALFGGALLKLLDDGALRASMGRAARDLLMRKFTVAAMADGVESVYARLG